MLIIYTEWVTHISTMDIYIQARVQLEETNGNEMEMKERAALRHNQLSPNVFSPLYVT